MNQTQKKRLALLVIGLAIGLIALVILIKTTLTPKLYTELIINEQNNVDLSDISILSADLSYKQIYSFSLDNQSLTSSKQQFVPYSEGFIEKDKFIEYQTIFSQNAQPLTSTFQDYYETELFTFFALPGDLAKFRILENTTGKLYSIGLPQEVYLHSMYVSDMKVVENQLIILAGEAMSYHALIYVVDLNTLEVTDWKRLETHPSALNSMHYTLTDDGIALFISGNALQIYNPLEDTLVHQSLSFEAEGVIYDKQHVLVYDLQEDRFNYILLEEENLLLTDTSVISDSLALPSSSAKVLDLSLESDLLYVLLEDFSAPRFKNYLSVYNLNTQEMIFCLGIGDSSPLILTQFKK